MSIDKTFHLVICGSVVPDPLQSLEPVVTAGKPGLKNELMLPMVLDPFVTHSLNEAAKLRESTKDTQIHLVAVGPKAKLQQLMMVLAQKTAFNLVAVDAPAGGFIDSHAVAATLAEAIKGIAGLDLQKTLVFGGWSSASRASGTTLQLVGEKLGITEQFFGVDRLTPAADGSFTVLERVEAGQHLETQVSGAPAVIGWATGDLPELPNNPKIGMMNMAKIMPAIGKAKAVDLTSAGFSVVDAALPAEKRQTRVVKDLPAAEVAAEIRTWIASGKAG